MATPAHRHYYICIHLPKEHIVFIPVYYMDNYCGSIISHGKFEQFRLKLTSSPNYQSDFQCEVTLETNPGDHMFIKFLFLDLEEASDCSYDWVELDDGSSRSAQYLAGM